MLRLPGLVYRQGVHAARQCHSFTPSMLCLRLSPVAKLDAAEAYGSADPAGAPVAAAAAGSEEVAAGAAAAVAGAAAAGSAAAALQCTNLKLNVCRAHDTGRCHSIPVLVTSFCCLSSATCHATLARLK